MVLWLESLLGSFPLQLVIWKLCQALTGSLLVLLNQIRTEARAEISHRRQTSSFYGFVPKWHSIRKATLVFSEHHKKIQLFSCIIAKTFLDLNQVESQENMLFWVTRTVSTVECPGSWSLTVNLTQNFRFAWFRHFWLYCPVFPVYRFPP